MPADRGTHSRRRNTAPANRKRRPGTRLRAGAASSASWERRPDSASRQRAPRGAGERNGARASGQPEVALTVR